MSDPNINPYYDRTPAERAEPAADAPPSHQNLVTVGDSGIPGWMPISALFVGLGLFAIVVVGAFSLTGKEAPPTQAAHQEGTTPEKQTSAQPDQSAGRAQQQQQQQQNQQGGGAPAQPPATNPASTTGAGPKQQ